MMIAAFFDMDHTLVRANTGTLWVRYMRQRGELDTVRALRALAWLVRYKLSILDMEAVTTRVTAEMSGASEAEMIEKCRVFTEDEVLWRIAPKAWAAIERHRREGHMVAILSSSSPYVTEPLARHLGIDHVLCTRLSVRNGRFDGKHVAPACYGPGKVHWAERFAREHEIDLDESYFYSDSYSDLPMLARVGVAKVVNPDPRLRRYAGKVGWEVDRW